MSCERCKELERQRDLALGGEQEKACRVASLEAALRDIAAPTRVYDEYDEEHSCAECGAYTMLEDGLEPAPECHPCSTSLLDKARSIARAVLASAAPATLVENHPAVLALRNVRMLVRRKWGKGIDEEWAEHLIRFCREGGVTDDILRAPDAQPRGEPE
jgi:hypothetical protein